MFFFSVELKIKEICESVKKFPTIYIYIYILLHLSLKNYSNDRFRAIERYRTAGSIIRIGGFPRGSGGCAVPRRSTRSSDRVIMSAARGERASCNQPAHFFSPNYPSCCPNKRSAAAWRRNYHRGSWHYRIGDFGRLSTNTWQRRRRRRRWDDWNENEDEKRPSLRLSSAVWL